MPWSVPARRAFSETSLPVPEASCPEMAIPSVPNLHKGGLMILTARCEWCHQIFRASDQHVNPDFPECLECRAGTVIETPADRAREELGRYRESEVRALLQGMVPQQRQGD